ncbi:unnamed protein product [Lepeophtheirus salmonis]|uniref:(salmon louse) hypothetical protein n=1 Tax=Lepeophtheirus salmonis TaxID=72036 RepID=A0A7R8D2L6_LEPSM|nr:unnamed protein product [Lepeophtheirus salmonis]CAF2977493.1 unnamed protein product [Lepeophtheirus salmonis]
MSIILITTRRCPLHQLRKKQTTSPNPSGGSYPDLASPTDSVIAGDFVSLSPQEQERQRSEWKTQLSQTEEEISTLKQVMESKEAQAAALKKDDWASLIGESLQRKNVNVTTPEPNNGSTTNSSATSPTTEVKK